MALGGPDAFAGPDSETVSPRPDVVPETPLPVVAQGGSQDTGDAAAPRATPTPAESVSPPAEVGGGYLPRTGVDVRTSLLIGVTLLLGGLALRRLTRRPSSAT